MREYWQYTAESVNAAGLEITVIKQILRTAKLNLNHDYICTKLGIQNFDNCEITLKPRLNMNETLLERTQNFVEDIPGLEDSDHEAFEEWDRIIHQHIDILKRREAETVDH